jgi:hypothetical protein
MEDLSGGVPIYRDEDGWKKEKTHSKDNGCLPADLSAVALAKAEALAKAGWLMACLPKRSGDGNFALTWWLRDLLTIFFSILSDWNFTDFHSLHLNQHNRK